MPIDAGAILKNSAAINVRIGNARKTGRIVLFDEKAEKWRISAPSYKDKQGHLGYLGYTRQSACNPPLKHKICPIFELIIRRGAPSGSQHRESATAASPGKRAAALASPRMRYYDDHRFQCG